MTSFGIDDGTADQTSRHTGSQSATPPTARDVPRRPVWGILGRVVGDGRGWVHVIDPREHGRPLDEREAREFERLVAGFDGPSAPRPAVAPQPRDGTGARPLTWRQVVLVLVASAVLAALTAALPAPLNLWSPVAFLVVLSLSCVVWGRLRERRGRG